MQVHVINLDRSPGRYDEFRVTNGHLENIIRFTAVDGQKVDLPTLVQHGLVGENILQTYSLGGVGLALSHIALWEQAISTGKVLTICEDDTIFNLRFDIYANDVIKRLPSDWDLILWGWNFDLFLEFEMLPGVSSCVAQFEQERMRSQVDAFQNQMIVPHPYKLNWAFGTACYTITPKGARTLRQKLLPLRPMLIPYPKGNRAPPFGQHYRTVGIDVSMNAFYKDMNAYICFPPLVITKNDSRKSTVQEQPQIH